MKAKVFQLIEGFRQGGTERQAVQLTRLLAESGRFQVDVACMNGEGALRAEIERLGFKSLPEFPLNSFYDAHFVRQLRRFAALLRAREIDIIHTHDFYTNIFGTLGATLARTPVRIASRRETASFRTKQQKRVERAVYHLAHSIVANAEAVREHLIAEGVSARKIEVIHNGLDLQRLAPQKLARDERLQMFNLPPDENRARRFVVIVANLRHHVKDIPTFLRAARRVRAQIEDAAFIIAGEGDLLDELREFAASLGLGEDVFFIGRCERVPDLLPLAEVCALSSTTEGFSNSILEYMAARRAVVATDVGGAREAVVEGETGFIVPPRDDERMAARIIELLNNPARARRMGERGRSRVEREFSCAAQLARTENLYERLLLKRRRAVGKNLSAPPAVADDFSSCQRASAADDTDRFCIKS
jgi:glycosyltransferase involved in cell wall biosynthesis